MKSNSSYVSTDLMFILAIQATFLLATFFNVLLLRQLLGLVMLTFVSGFLILRLMKLDRRLGLANTVLLSVGLSVSFDMFLGLLADLLLPLAGIGRPLDELPVLVVFNLSLVLVLLGSQVRERKLGFDPKSIFSWPVLAFVVCLPLLSVIGSFYASASSNGILLLGLVAVIIVILFLSVLFRSRVSRFFMLIIFVMAVALLFRPFFISQNVSGYDQFDEYYVFREVNSKGYWNQSLNWSGDIELLKANGMLSVTILPQVYSQVLGIDSNLTFGLLYPLIAVFIFAVLHELYSTQISKTDAFLSMFFFISVAVGFDLGPEKQVVATLFYVLIIFLFLNKVFPPVQKNILLIIFGASIIVSHYSLSYLLVFMVFFIWLYSFVTKKHGNRTSLGMSLLFLAMAFSWYVFVSGSGPFLDFVKFGNNIYSNFLTDFFNPASRGSTVLSGLGLQIAESSLHQIGRYVFYATEAFMVLGFIIVVVQRRKLRFDKEFTAIILFNVVVLALTIVVPTFATSFREERFYEVAVLFLSPLAILGIKGLSEIGRKLSGKSSFLGLALIVLAVFFLFQSEFVYAITGDVTWSLEMSMYNPNRLSLLAQSVWQSEVKGAQWVDLHIMNASRIMIFADVYGQTHVLSAYGSLDREEIHILSPGMESLPSRSSIFLRWANIDPGIMTGENYYWNTTGIAQLLNSVDTVYSNGHCEIFQNP